MLLFALANSCQPIYPDKLLTHLSHQDKRVLTCRNSLLITGQLINRGLCQDSHLAVPTNPKILPDELCPNQFALKDPP